MSKRRFEFVDGRSFKFWEISVAGSRATVSFGRIGAGGQSLTKTFHDPDEAARYAAKLIAAKIKKGYAEAAPV